MLGGLIKGTVESLKELYDKGYRLYALSNWSAETLPLAQERYNFFPLFSGMVISGQEKTIKPDPGLYKILLSRYQLDPAETLFIDDHYKNTISAPQLCIKTIDFVSPLTFRAALTTRGIF